MHTTYPKPYIPLESSFEIKVPNFYPSWRENRKQERKPYRRRLRPFQFNNSTRNQTLHTFWLDAQLTKHACLRLRSVALLLSIKEETMKGNGNVRKMGAEEPEIKSRRDRDRPPSAKMAKDSLLSVWKNNLFGGLNKNPSSIRGWTWNKLISKINVAPVFSRLYTVRLLWLFRRMLLIGGCNSAVECLLRMLKVLGSNPSISTRTLLTSWYYALWMSFARWTNHILTYISRA